MCRVDPFCCITTSELPYRFELIEKCHTDDFDSPRFLCDNDITIADLVLYTIVTGVQDGTYCTGVNASAFPAGRCPRLKLIVEQIGMLEAVKKWNNASSGIYESCIEDFVEV